MRSHTITILDPSHAGRVGTELPMDRVVDVESGVAEGVGTGVVGRDNKKGLAIVNQRYRRIDIFSLQL